MKGKRKTICDPLSGIPVDLLYGDTGHILRYLKAKDLEDDDLEGAGGACYNLRHIKSGQRRFAVWIRDSDSLQYLAEMVAHECLHLVLGLQKAMNLDADHLDVIEGTNEEPLCYHFETLFSLVWAWISKVSDSAGSEDSKLDS